MWRDYSKTKFERRDERLLGLRMSGIRDFCSLAGRQDYVGERERERDRNWMVNFRGTYERPSFFPFGDCAAFHAQTTGTKGVKGVNGMGSTGNCASDF